MTTVSPYVALTGRVQSYLEQTENNLFPVSCTMYKYDNNVFDLIKYLSVALRGGAGVSVNLDDFIQQPVNSYNFYFYLPETHPDYVQLTDEQLTRWIDPKTIKFTGCNILVNDSMEEDDEYTFSIQDSWRVFIEALTEDNYIPIVDLSKLRPSGTSNSKGLTASGAVSFLTIYEAIINHLNKGDLISLMQLAGQMNEVLRRGGAFKNGIVTFSLIYTHPDIIKYLNVPLSDIPGSGKKAIRLDTDMLSNRRLMKLIEVRVNDKSLFLMKTSYQVDIHDQFGVAKTIYEIGVPLHLVQEKYKHLGEFVSIIELFSQVCVELFIRPNATCLLIHINGGQIDKLEDIVPAFEEAARIGVNLHRTWKGEVGGRASQYLSAEDDRQIGIGWIGVANMLAHFGIKYIDFIEAGEDSLEYGYTNKSVAHKLISAIYDGYQAAAEIGREAGLERMFTIAPTQSCAFRYEDLDGNTVCKQINPPLDRRTRRTSHTVDSLAGVYYYGAKVETMKSLINENGVDVVQRLWELWQQLMNTTGMAHCMSFDLYREIDEEWLRDFMLRSPLATTYYQLADKVDQSYLNKSVAQLAESEQVVCAITNPGQCLSCSE